MNKSNLKAYFLSAVKDIKLLKNGSGQSLTSEIENKMVSYGWNKKIEIKTKPLVRHSFEQSIGPPYDYQYEHKSWSKEGNHTNNSSEWYSDLCKAMKIDKQETFIRRRLTNTQNTNEPT